MPFVTDFDVTYGNALAPAVRVVWLLLLYRSLRIVESINLVFLLLCLNRYTFEMILIITVVAVTPSRNLRPYV